MGAFTISRSAITQLSLNEALMTLDRDGVDYTPRIRAVLRRAFVHSPEERASAAELVGIVEQHTTMASAFDDGDVVQFDNPLARRSSIGVPSDRESADFGFKQRRSSAQ